MALLCLTFKSASDYKYLEKKTNQCGIEYRADKMSFKLLENFCNFIRLSGSYYTHVTLNQVILLKMFKAIVEFSVGILNF